MITSASFGNPEHSVVRAVFQDGSVGPVLPTDERLAGLDIGSYVEPVFAARRVMSPLAFFDRFTAEEEAGIAAAALAEPQVLLWLTKASGALEIDLDDARTQMGLGLLVYAGLLTAERVAEIVA